MTGQLRKLKLKKRSLQLLLAASLFILIYYLYNSRSISDKLSEIQHTNYRQGFSYLFQLNNTSELTPRLMALNKCLEENGYKVDDENLNQDALSQQRIFPPSYSSEMINTLGNLRILGFQFCSILNNARFDPWVHIFGLDGSLVQVNPPQLLFTKMIDKAAQSLVEIFKKTYRPLDEESVRRFSCYTAVSGQSRFMALSDESILLEVDANNYFPYLSILGTDPAPQYRISSHSSKRRGLDLDWNLDMNIAASEKFPIHVSVQPGLSQVEKTTQRLKSSSQRKRFKIAYLILAHDNIDTLVEMFKHLYSKEAIFLIHIDGNHKDAQTTAQNYIKQHYNDSNNIYFFEKPFYLQWGSPYIVIAQLEGYFQLLDLADWDYAINLSAEDFPLMSTAAIHKKLEENPGKSYIEYWELYSETVYRLSSLCIPLKSRKELLFKDNVRIFHKFHKFPPIKHHQWMILSRELVQLMRKSQQTYDLLAFMENTLIPDESFFIMLALSPDLNYKDKVVSDSKRFIYFHEGNAHPLSLRDGDENLLTKHGKQYYFVRKVNAFTEKKLVKWMVDKKNEIDKQLGIKAE